MIQSAALEVPSVGQFVGRELELAALAAGLKQARAGRGALFLIRGEPGIGKSRLTDEFAGLARESGAAVLWGRCWEGGGAPAYWPWIQALRAHIRNTDAARVRAELAAGAADVAQVLPEIGTIVPDLPPPPPESDSARFQLFDSTTTFIRNVALSRPTVLVLDDLQSADTPSILLLRFLASQLSDMQLMAVATYRDVELTPDHPLTAALHEMLREPTTRLITLTGLPQRDVARFVEVTAGQGSHAQLVTRLWRETNGNPLFVGEAVRLLAAEGRLDDDAAAEQLSLTLPAGLREVIMRRVRQLREPTIQTLVQAAALGPEFSAEVLRRVGGYAGEELLEVLGDATRAGLLIPAGRGRFRFSHDLVREALYADLPPSQRARLHRRIAEALEELYESSPEAHLAELAHHYYEAALGGVVADNDLAATSKLQRSGTLYARKAGEQAARSLAYEEAARLYRMALQLLDVDEPSDAAERTEILLALGDAHARAGDLPSARPIFLDAARLARRSGAPQAFARAALGYGGRFLWARAGNDTEFVPLLQEALVLLGGSDDELRVRLLSRLACAWRGSAEHFDQSAALSQQAVDIARRLGDPATLSYALTGRYGAIYWPHTTAERHEIARELLAQAEAAGDGERIIDAHMILSFTYADLARMAEARAEMQTLTRVARELRQPTQLWLANAMRCSYALLEGDYAAAEELILVESAPGLPTTPIQDDVSAMRMHRFLLRRELGKASDEEASLRSAVAEFPWYPVHRAALTCCLLDMGREAEARSLLAVLGRNEFGALVRDNEWLLSVAFLGEATARLDDGDAAAILYAQLLPFAGLHAIAHGEGSVGIVDRYLGLLAMALGRVEDAEEHLRSAIRLNDQMGAHPWRAHSQYELAGLLRRTGRRTDNHEADQLERDALGTAETLGMTDLAARLANAAGSVASAGAPSADSGSAGTFRHEGEYWMIAFGNDNFRLRDAKGLRYLARLLAEPGREMLALELAREDDPAPAAASGRAARSELRSSDIGDSGAQLDDQAKAAYRARLHELQQELDEAESWNDPERAERARGEMDFLARELSRAVGLGGRDRASGSASERARLSVTRAIRLAMARIAAHSSMLAEHLETSIHTGTYCAYRPDPRLPVTWQH